MIFFIRHKLVWEHCQNSKTNKSSIAKSHANDQIRQCSFEIVMESSIAYETY